MKIKYRTPKEVVQHWIHTLESGLYAQTQGQLKKNLGTTIEAFCCLGVLCDLNAKDGGAAWEHEDIYFNNYDNSEYLPKVIQDYVMLKDSDVKVLIDMNDQKGKSFHQIAKYIKETILPRHKV